MRESYLTSLNSEEGTEVQERIATGFGINVRDESVISGGTRAGLVSRIETCRGVK